MTDYPLNGRGKGHVTRVLKFCPNHIFGVYETRHFICHVLIDTEVDYSVSQKKRHCFGLL